MKLFRMAREGLIAILVYNILINTMLMNILKWINLWTRFVRILRIKLGMLYDLSSQASTLIIDLNVLCWS